MGSLALIHEGAISRAGQKEANGVGALAIDALDALDAALFVGDMTPSDQDHFLPWSFFDARAATSATTLEPPHLLSLELDTRTPDCPSSSSNPLTLALSFDFNHFSLQLPLFANSDATTASGSRAADKAIDNRLGEPSEPNGCRADFPLFYTFFHSPSTSTTSLASSSYSSDITSYLSQETKPAMPGPTLVAPVGVVFSRGTDDHFAKSMTDEAGGRMSTDQLRPHSAQSINKRRSRSASPMFTLWTRRHHHQHDRSNRSSAEIKPNGTVHKRAATLSRSGSIQKRQVQGGVVPQMTREEFEALPLAIQRKYFSTLERLRFARDSGRVDGISQHYDDISNFRRRKSRQDRSVSEHIGGRNRRQSFFESNLSIPDSLPSYASLPDKIKRKEFTREEQVILASRLRASVILDAADEAICKINRRASRNLRPSDQSLDTSLSLSPRRASMDSHDGLPRSSDRSPSKDAPQSFYDSFRWLDEEEDLDLRLFLDDYHANLRDELPSPTKQQRPSFRRHLSISKIPFGRNSVSLSRPGTNDNSTPISPTQATFGHPRRKSRALSLITPKHMSADSIGGFDPAAAHYQDPEARLKLRVYLASPQKFDEAIEFGFPSADVLSPGSGHGKEGDLARRRQSRQKEVDTSANMHSFLADHDDDDDENDADDRLSLNSDHASMADPDSPKTPQAFDNKLGTRAGRSLRLASTEPPHFCEGGGTFMEGVGGYAQAPASSREMTLRMTLTRPDLRADEDQIYGWQQTQGVQPGRKSTTLAQSGMENTATYIGEGANKESLEKMGVNFDQWGPSPTEKGVMKRIWNRVRRA